MWVVLIFFFLMIRRPPISTLVPYTTLFQSDDGLNFALGPGLSMPVDEVFTYLNENTVQGVLEQAILQAPLFVTRWRWNATRSLAILRHTGGRKVPAPLIRMRSEDLLAAVFPAQVACQDNAMPGDIEVPDHPLVFETMRDCLTRSEERRVGKECRSRWSPYP